MRKRAFLMTLAALFGVAAVGLAAARFRTVQPQEFDPARTHLVQAEWLSGIGCPTDAKTAPFLPPDFSEGDRRRESEGGAPAPPSVATTTGQT